MRLFVDLDGVLVNLHRAACPLFGVAYPKNEVLDYSWSYRASGLSVEDYLDRLDRSVGFWENLPTFAWTAELLQVIEEVCPDWKILTSATQDPASWQGKAAWVKRFFGPRGMQRLVINHGDKSTLACSDGVLIDDHKVWCDNWIERGGLGAFHWIEYSDEHGILVKSQMALLRDHLSKFVR